MLKNMKIQSKIISAITGFSLIAFSIIFYTIVQMNFLNSVINELSTNRIPKLVAVYKISDGINTIARSTRAMYIFKGDEIFLKEKSQILDFQKMIDKNLEYLKATIVLNKELLAKILEENSEFLKIQNKFITAMESKNNNLAYTILYNELRPVQRDLLLKADQLMIDELNKAQKKSELGSESVYLSLWVIVISSIIAVILIIIGSRLIILALVVPIQSLEKTVVEISEQGNFNARIDVDLEAQDELGSFGRSFQRMMKDFREMQTDTEMLIKSAIEGKLTIRADATKYEGDNRKIVEGINKILDSVVVPLNMAAECVDKISSGLIPEKITDNYNGDFNIIKNNLNLCIENITKLISDANILSISSIEGRLSTRADETRHQGDFRKIIEGFNKTLDAVIEPIQETASVLDELSNNNLSVRVMGEYKGDHAKIANALNNTIDSISGIITQIKNASEQMLQSSKQLADSSQNLASGSSEQASSTEEITSALYEIETQSKNNSDSSITASDLSKNVNEKAAKGNKEMEDLLLAMKELNISSEKISKVVKEIESIAFQTNILALNAAVEAARAGQHGKGFNVVATEVRNLAIRSSNSAKETSVMVEETIKKITSSAKLAESNSESLKTIVDGITKLTELVSSVALSSNEQRLGIAQVNSGINEIAKVTMSNSASAEEMATASEELTGQAKSFNEMVSIFKIKDIQENTHIVKMNEKPKKKIAL